MIILSLTNQGDISSRLVSPWRLLELLLMMLDLWPFAMFSELNLFSVLLLLRILVFYKLVARTTARYSRFGSLEYRAMERDLVKGWLLANVVHISLKVKVLDPLSETGSRDAPGEIPGEVDIWEPEVSSPWW